MNFMKLAFYETEEWQIPVVRQSFPNDEILFFDHTLDPSTLETAKGVDVVSVFIDSQINADMISQLKDTLKLITTRSTGYNHIDLAAATQYLIPVSTVPQYGENTVAEHAFALLLTISRKIYQTLERTERGRFDLEGLQGFDLKGKTIGIYGLGSIGIHMAKMAKGFEMKILAYKRTPDPKLAEELGIEFVSNLEELLSRSDVISLHCPLTPETTHLINMDNIQHIKKGAVLINTARGGLVETEALLQALNDEIISAAGLDVLEEEIPLKDDLTLLSKTFHEQVNWKTVLEDHVLINRDDVIFTAHNAFNSFEAVNRILNTTIDNIHQFFSGNPQNTVTQ